MKDEVYRCAILISGKVIVFRQDPHRYPPNVPMPWKSPCEVSVAADDENNVYIGLKRVDLFNREDCIEPPDESQILSTYEPDDYLIAKYQDAVEQQAEQLSGAVQ